VSRVGGTVTFPCCWLSSSAHACLPAVRLCSCWHLLLSYAACATCGLRDILLARLCLLASLMGVQPRALHANTYDMGSTLVEHALQVPDRLLACFACACRLDGCAAAGAPC
jgi:hypothetical protein